MRGLLVSTASAALLAAHQSAAFLPSGPRRHRATRRSETVNMGIKINAWEYTNGVQSPKLQIPGGKSTKTLDPPDDFTITPEQIETLKRDGVVHIKGLLSDEWLAYLREATEWQMENPHIWASPGVASGIYDYIQRSIWTTNDAFASFLYFSPVATALAKLGETESIRLSTDLLMVNPNNGFKWHQDNQNGPVRFEDALRWWVTMDDTPPDHGAPVYLKGSHKNECVSNDAVFVNIEDGDLPNYPEQLSFRPKAGDLIVWDARAIHKIDGPKNKDWGVEGQGGRKRRVLGGTGVIAGAPYMGEERALFSDMSTHTLQDGDMLAGPQWPQLYPSALRSEVDARARGECSRSMEGFLRMAGNMVASVGEMGSWLKVYNKDKKLKEEIGEGGVVSTTKEERAEALQRR